MPHGFRHRDLRPQVAALLGFSLQEYTPSEAARSLPQKGKITMWGLISID